MSGSKPNTAPRKAKNKNNSAEESKPRLINREVLGLLGYRVTKDGFENKKRQMQIIRLERIDNGSTPDFCYCSHSDKDIGFILPHPFQHYAERLPTRRKKEALS